MHTIAVLSALTKESALFWEMPGKDPQFDQGVCRATRTIGDRQVVAATTGMGIVNAAASAQQIIDSVRPDAIVLSGIAGSLNPRLGMGDVVVSERLCFPDADMAIVAESFPHLQEFSSDERLVRAAVAALQSLGHRQVCSLAERPAADADPFGEVGPHEPRYVVGAIATSDLFATAPRDLARIRDTYQADCEEMEGAAVAQVCARAGIPFVAIRAISNVCGESYEDLDGRQADLAATARLAARVAHRLIENL